MRGPLTPGLPVRADVSVYVTLDRSTDPREYGDRAEITRLSPTPARRRAADPAARVGSAAWLTG